MLTVERIKYIHKLKGLFFGILMILLLLFTVGNSWNESSSGTELLKRMLVREMAEKISGDYAPLYQFARAEESSAVWGSSFGKMMPIYSYAASGEKVELPEEGSQMILSLENMELPVMSSDSGTNLPDREETLQELIQAENEAALEMRRQNAFIPHGIQNMVDLKALSDYETLVSTFYTIDANTMSDGEELNVADFLEKDMKITGDGAEPQILIYHTHSQEGFSDSVPGDVNTTIVGVGARLCEILTNTYGYNVLHHTGQYDVDTRDDAYANSLPAIEQLLAEHPSIEVVIDLHRDSMPEGTKLVMDLDGRPTARFMFFNGLSRTRNTGDIAYLYNEYLQDNLAFSFQMQLKATQYYPGLTRKIYLKGYRYNMHLCPKTTLVELGAQNNTVEEAMNACEPLAHIIHMVLSGEE